MREEAKLLERFGRLELGRLQLSITGERRAVVAIHADMDPVVALLDPFGRIDAPEVRDRAAGEIDRFALLGADDLDHARGEEAFGRVELGDRRHQPALRLLPARDESVKELRLDERLVALDVEEELARQAVDDAGHAGRTGRTGRIGDQHFGAETAGDRGDFLRIRQQHHAVRLADLLGALPDMLDDRLTAEVEQDLAGQTRGSDASGDAKSDGGHFSSGGKWARGHVDKGKSFRVAGGGLGWRVNNPATWDPRPPPATRSNAFTSALRRNGRDTRRRRRGCLRKGRCGASSRARGCARRPSAYAACRRASTDRIPAGR